MPLFRVRLAGDQEVDIEADRHKRLTYDDHEGGEPGDLLFFAGGDVIRRYTKDEWKRYEEVDDPTGPLDYQANTRDFGGNAPQS